MVTILSSTKKFIRRLNSALNVVKSFVYRFTSIRWKLFITYLLISLVPIFYFSNSLSSKIESYFVYKASTELKNFANRIAGTVSGSGYLSDESLRPMFDSAMADYVKERPVRIIVVDHRAVVANDTGSTGIGIMFLAPEVLDALNKKDVYSVQAEEGNIVAAVTIYDKENVAGAVYIVSSMEGDITLLSQIRGEFLNIASLLSFVVIMLVMFLSQLLLVPLRKIMRVVQRMSDGHINERIVLTGHDEFTELGDAFNDMTEQLYKVDATRQEFVSNVSHELKTPLSSIKVLSESLLLQDEVPNETYREFMQDINSEIDRMVNIINELLALVRLEQTENPLNITTFRVNKMVEDILKRLYPLAEQKNIELLYEDVRSISLDGDEMKLSLAISNLIENSIKYTNGGGTVKVIVDCDHQNAFITVQDTGIGIAESEQSKIFTRFYRVDKTRDRHTGGTGLGLAITQKTVLLHNGSVRLMSRENEGSSFVVRIPLHQASPQA